MRTVISILGLLVAAWAISASAASCRFASQFTPEQLVQSPSARNAFLEAAMMWEGQFAKVGLTSKSAMTYDGTELDWTSGKPTAPLHTFSAASKESIHFMILVHVLKGNKLASKFLEPETPSAAFDTAFRHLQLKISVYEAFNEQFPGYGGWLPWFTNLDDGSIVPAPGWDTVVPSLDNGENIWAIYAVKTVLQDLSELGPWRYRPLAAALQKRYQALFDLLASTSLTVFYQDFGDICAVSHITNISAQPTPEMYSCPDKGYLNDPYEGELFTWFVYFFGNWTDVSQRTGHSVEQLKQQLWINKRPQLVPVTYQTDQGPLTVQRGWCFSSHEQWKYLEMPYLSVPVNKKLFLNGEKARTWNSFKKSIPGLYASVNDVVFPKKPQDGYISSIGIQELASERIERTDVLTPYGAYPVVLANQTVGLVWYHRMLLGTAMQGPLGSTESINLNATELSPLVTWDSKITTIVAMLGGIGDLVGQYMKRDGIYDEFYRIVDREWSMAFPNIQGGDSIDFKLPSAFLPQSTTFTDFNTCTKSHGG